MTSGFQVFLGFMISVGVIAYAIGQWRTGRAVSAASTIQLLQDRADTLEKAFTDAQTESKQDHEEIIKLQSELKHTKEENARLLAIIANRSPDLEKVLTEVRGYLAILVENQKPPVILDRRTS